VPEALRNPQRFVNATRDAYAGIKPDESGRLHLRRRAGIAHLKVSRDQLRRSLLILQVAEVAGRIVEQQSLLEPKPNSPAPSR
jgi:hypothetical protein